MCTINDALNVNLAQVNVWLDVVFFTLMGVMGIGLLVHFGGSLINGRFNKKWKQGLWPEHDEPHPPALPKIIHFIHLAMMVILAFTGMVIRFPMAFPALEGMRTAMRYTHYVAMVVVGLTYFWRVWYAFGSSARDWRAFAITKRDLKSTLGVLMYYSYMSNNKPHTAKYNVMQKMAYDFFAIAMILQGFTGICLLTQPIIFGYSPRYLMTFLWAPLVGGIAMAGAWMRIFHYTFNWLFIVATTVHVYLALTEDVPVALDFFGVEYGGYIAWADDESSGHAGGHAPVAEEPALADAH